MGPPNGNLRPPSVSRVLPEVRVGSQRRRWHWEQDEMRLARLVLLPIQHGRGPPLEELAVPNQVRAALALAGELQQPLPEDGITTVRCNRCRIAEVVNALE